MKNADHTKPVADQLYTHTPLLNWKIPIRCQARRKTLQQQRHDSDQRETEKWFLLFECIKRMLSWMQEHKRHRLGALLLPCRAVARATLGCSSPCAHPAVHAKVDSMLSHSFHEATIVKIERMQANSIRLWVWSFFSFWLRSSMRAAMAALMSCRLHKCGAVPASLLCLLKFCAGALGATGGRMAVYAVCGGGAGNDDVCPGYIYGRIIFNCAIADCNRPSFRRTFICKSDNVACSSMRCWFASVQEVV